MKVVALVLGFLLFAPVILWIVVSEWARYLLRGPLVTMPPPVTLPPDFPTWAATMERGRQAQAHEEN
jgi:hypothetical protein